MHVISSYLHILHLQTDFQLFILHSSLIETAFSQKLTHIHILFDMGNNNQ